MTDRDATDTRVSVFEIVDGKRRARSWEEFLALRGDRERLFRVDLSAAEPGSLEARIRAIHENPLVVERCMDPHSVSGVHVYDDMLALQLPMADDWDAPSYPKLAVFAFPNAVISVHVAAAGRTDDDVERRLAIPIGRPLHAEGLLLSVLDTLVDRSSEQTLEARACVDRMEKESQQIPDEEQFGIQMLWLKRAAAHFEMAMEAKHRTLTALLSQDSDLIDLRRIREPLRDVVAHIEHSLHYIERVENRLSELDRHFLLLLQDRTNNRLRVLTIVSAIFMPLTLIAGIYGMNFHAMPELSWAYGYPIALLVMLAISVGLLWFFQRRGWFR